LGVTGTVRGRRTLEFKQEAVRLVRGGQATFSAARTLAISGQTPHNRVKAEAAGRLREIAGKTVSAEQMEIARVKAELAKFAPPFSRNAAAMTGRAVGIERRVGFSKQTGNPAIPDADNIRASRRCLRRGSRRHDSKNRKSRSEHRDAIPRKKL
jgi:transposase